MQKKIAEINQDDLENSIYFLRYFILSLNLKPPKGFSLEKICFMISSIHSLIQYIFSYQKPDFKYTTQINRMIKIIKEKPLSYTEDTESFFQKNIKDSKFIEFLNEGTYLINPKDHLSLSQYRKKFLELKSKENTEYLPRMKDLPKLLKNHLLKSDNGIAFKIWNEIKTINGTIAEELRKNWIEGDYLLTLSNNEFKNFIKDETNYRFLNSTEKRKVYDSFILRIPSLGISSDEIIDVITYFLSEYKEKYLSEKNIKYDIVFLLTTSDIDIFKLKIKEIASTIENPKKLFYLSDIDINSLMISDERISNFEEKLNIMIELFNDSIKNEEFPNSDLWENPLFKVLYLMISTHFKLLWQLNKKWN